MIWLSLFIFTSIQNRLDCEEDSYNLITLENIKELSLNFFHLVYFLDGDVLEFQGNFCIVFNVGNYSSRYHILVADRYLDESDSIFKYEFLILDLFFFHSEGKCLDWNPAESKEEKFYIFFIIL